LRHRLFDTPEPQRSGVPFRGRFGWLVLVSTLFNIITYTSYTTQDYNLSITWYILFRFAITIACTGLLLLVRRRRNYFYDEVEKTAGSNERTKWGRWFAYTFLPIVCVVVMVVTTIASTIINYAVTQWTSNLGNAELAFKSFFHIVYIFLVASLVFSSTKVWRRLKQRLSSPIWEVYDLNVSALFPFILSTITKPRLTRLTGSPSWHHFYNLSPPLHRRTSQTRSIHRRQRRQTVRVCLPLSQIHTKPYHRLHYYPWTSLDCHSPSNHFARKPT